MNAECNSATRVSFCSGSTELLCDSLNNSLDASPVGSLQAGSGELQRRVSCQGVTTLNLKDLPRISGEKPNCFLERKTSLRSSASTMSDEEKEKAATAKLPIKNLALHIGNWLGKAGRQLEEEGGEIVRSRSVAGMPSDNKDQEKMSPAEETKNKRSASLSESPRKNDSVYHPSTPHTPHAPHTPHTPRTPRAPHTPLSSRVSTSKEHPSASEICSRLKASGAPKQINWDAYSEVPEKFSDDYHRQLNEYLRKTLQEAAKGTVSSHEVDNLIREVCMEALDEIPKEIAGSPKSLKEGCSPRSLRIYQRVNGALIEYFIERLQVMRQALYSFLETNRMKSSCIKYLVSLLNELVLAGTPYQENISLRHPEFLEKLAAPQKGRVSRFLEKESKQKAQQILEGTVFKDPKDIKPKLLNLSLDARATEIIKDVANTLRDEKQLTENHLYTVDTKLKSTSSNKDLRISQITVEEVLRSIIMDGVPKVDLTINGIPFFVHLDPSATENAKSRAYFKELFSAFRETFFRCAQDDFPELLIDCLHDKATVELPKNQPLEFSYLDLLRTCTINAWAHAYKLAHDNWSLVFNNIHDNAAYETKASKTHLNLRASIIISGPQEFKTILTSSYTIKTPRPAFAALSTQSEQRILAYVELEFCLKPGIENGLRIYEGDLRVSKLTFDPSTTEEERKGIIEAFKNTLESKAEDYMLASPRLSKTPKSGREILGTQGGKSPRTPRSEGLMRRNSTSLPKLIKR